MKNNKRLLVIIIIVAIFIVVITPFIFGITIFNVSSYSMYPTLVKGDIVFIKSNNNTNNEYSIDDIVVIKKDNEYIIHRIVQVDKNNQQYITRGDNNKYEDEQHISKSDIVGKYIWAIKIGKYLYKYGVS